MYDVCCVEEKDGEREMATESHLIHSTPSPLHSLTAHNPYYENSLLKANITWSNAIGNADFIGDVS